MTTSSSNSFTEFPAHAFHASLKNGRSSGVLRVSASGFHFLVEGEVKVHFPLEGIQLKLGGASDRMIFFSHPSFDDWSIYSSDLSLLKHPGLNSIAQVAEQIKQMKSKRRFNGSVFAVVAAAFLLVPLLLVLNMDSVAAVLARQIPLEWEQKLGESTHAQYQLDHDTLEQEKADKLLAQLTGTLTDAVHSEVPEAEQSYDFKFYIVNDASLNAFALPGGYIVIHTGLILRADSAEELLGVLAHEISHVTEQHGLRNIITSAGVIVIVQAMFGDASGLLATIASATPFLLNLQYSRGFETDADEKGFALLRKARINPDGLVSFFEKLMLEHEKMLDKVEDEDTAELLDTVSGFLSTHPATQDRIDHIHALAANERVNNYRDMSDPFLKLKTLVEAFVADQSTDEDLPYED